MSALQLREGLRVEVVAPEGHEPFPRHERASLAPSGALRQETVGARELHVHPELFLEPQERAEPPGVCVTPHAAPGPPRAKKGIASLARSQETGPSLLVSVGVASLRLLGFGVPPVLPDAERRLHRLPERGGPDSAHGRSSALGLRSATECTP